MTDPESPHAPRQRWMSVLARADADALGAMLDSCGSLPGYHRLRGPEGGLVMVRGRAGGSGAPFNLGEITVTRCTIRTDRGHVGHAYVAGRQERRAELAAFADALMQDPDFATTIEAQVITPLQQQQSAQRAQRAARADATRVQFFAMQTMRT